MDIAAIELRSTQYSPAGNERAVLRKEPQLSHSVVDRAHLDASCQTRSYSRTRAATVQGALLSAGPTVTELAKNGLQSITGPL